MNGFEIGDWVIAGEYYLGQIVDFTEDYAIVEFDTGGGGGCMPFDWSDIERGEDPNSPEAIAKHLLRKFDSLVGEAKDLGFDIRFGVNSTHSLCLYHHEDYPNMLLVDKNGGVDI